MAKPLDADLRRRIVAAIEAGASCRSAASRFWDGVTVMMNRNSGNVFLIDSEYNVGMMNGDKLEQWHYCGDCGHEGFAEDVFETVPVTFDGEPDGAERRCVSCGHVHEHLTQAELKGAFRDDR